MLCLSNPSTPFDGTKQSHPYEAPHLSRAARGLMMQVCGRCRKRKKASDFHRTRTRSDGLSSSCKARSLEKIKMSRMNLGDTHCSPGKISIFW